MKNNKTEFSVDERYRKQAESFVATIENATFQGCSLIGENDLRVWFRIEDKFGGKLSCQLLPIQEID